MIWGALSLGIMTLHTGGGLLAYLAVRFNRKCWCLVGILFQLTYFLFWPFYVLLIKAASIFVDGQDDWKSANMNLTGIEGIFEAQAQFLLQLYIAFNRPDRELTTLQIQSLITSLMSIVLAKIEVHFAGKPQTSISTKASLFPLYLAFSIFFLGSWALMLATLRFYFCFVALFFWGVSVLNAKMKEKSGKFLTLTIPMIFNAILLIVVAILVNCFSSSIKIMTITALPFIDEHLTDHIYLSDVDIVQRMCYKRLSYFNSMFLVCLSSLALYLLLAYFQVGFCNNNYREIQEEKAKKTIQETKNNADQNESNV